MPELPEVEALRRGLEKRVVGSKILKVQILHEKIVSGKGTARKIDEQKTVEFAKNLKNKKIVDIKRRAKNLIFVFETGEIMLVHLKMTGQLVFVPKASVSNVNPGVVVVGGHPIEESENKLPHKHTHIIFTLTNGTLYYNDVRKFGYVLYYPDEKTLEKEKHFDKMGVEPFDTKFTLKYFIDHLAGKSTPIKKLLLDQHIVVGCGNIYCDEILWASSVLPTRQAKSLTHKEVGALYTNILKILDKAIESGGSSVANYLLADGKRGNYSDHHQAYNRQGSRCQYKTGNRQCTGIIKKTNFAGRGTHFCPLHQK
jgi:formamidopyrimidine-DNA glycosylase